MENKKNDKNSSGMTRFSKLNCSDENDMKQMVDEYCAEFLKEKDDKFFFEKLNAEKKRNFLLMHQMFISNHYIGYMKDRKFLPQYDWRYVDSLKLRTYDKITCPICRESNNDIVNSHITFCGHIFCLYCIIRTQQMGKEKCPVCNEPCTFLDQKTIEIELQRIPHKKDYISFNLMKKYRQSFDVIPIGFENDTESVKNFQKLFSSSIEDRNTITEREINNLQDFQQSDDFPLKNPDALAALEQSFALVLAKTDLYYNKSEIKEYTKKIKYKKENQNINQGDVIYFYQESSGSLLFMNPINCQYLFKQSTRDQPSDAVQGEIFPPYQINAQLMNIEKYTQKTDMRKKYRSFAHVPNNLDVRVAAIKMDDFLKNNLLNEYLKEIRMHEKENKKEFYKAERKTNRYQKEVEQRIAEEQEKFYELYINEAPAQIYTEKVEDFEKNKDNTFQYPDLKTFAPEVVEDPMLKKLREYEEDIWNNKNAKKWSESSQPDEFPDLINQEIDNTYAIDMNNITKKKSKKGNKKKTKNAVALDLNVYD